MFHVVLHQPEIPPNTGNLIRLSANAPCHLHLIHPLGFDLSIQQVRRAGLDYHDLARVTEHSSFDAFLEAKPFDRLFAFSTKGASCYADTTYQPGDALMFGSETRGLPDDILKHDAIEALLRIPMCSHSRSLNLSNSVAIVVYEAWRQLGYKH